MSDKAFQLLDRAYFEFFGICGRFDSERRNTLSFLRILIVS